MRDGALEVRAYASKVDGLAGEPAGGTRRHGDGRLVDGQPNASESVHMGGGDGGSDGIGVDGVGEGLTCAVDVGFAVEDCGQTRDSGREVVCFFFFFGEEWGAWGSIEYLQD